MIEMLNAANIRTLFDPDFGFSPFSIINERICMHECVKYPFLELKLNLIVNEDDFFIGF
jgi:hypothetical protein